jgi:DNA primase
VLNSVSLLGAAVKVALRYPEIDCYFDHDKPGREATREFLKALPYARNRSDAFKGYHDYNAKRKAEAKAKRLADHPPVKGFFDQVSVTFGR